MFLSALVRVIGNTVILGLAAIGAKTVFNKIMRWKHAHDNGGQAANPA